MKLNNFLSLFLREISRKGITLLKREKIFVLGNYLKQATSALFTIYVAKSIDPENYGILGIIVLLETYSRILNFGSGHIVNKELSIDLNDLRVYKYWLISIPTFSLLITACAFVIIEISTLKEVHPYLFLIAIYIIMNFFYESNMGILRAHLASNLLGYNSIGGAVATVFIIVYYLYFGVPNNPTPLIYKLVIVTFVQLFISFFNLAFFKLNIRKILSAKITLKYYKNMIKRGLALSAYVYATDIYNSLDRLFILKYYGPKYLGFYTFANQLLMPFQMLVQSFYYIDFSRYLKDMHLIKNINEFNIARRKILKKYLTIWGSLIVPSFVAVFLVINEYFTNYDLSFFIFVLLFMIGVARVLNFSNTTFLIAKNQFKYLLISLLISIVIFVIFALIIVSINLPYYILLFINGIITVFFFQYFLLFHIKKSLIMINSKLL